MFREKGKIVPVELKVGKTEARHLRDRSRDGGGKRVRACVVAALAERVLMNAISPSSDAWATAARMLVSWLEANERADALLETFPPALSRVERARCQHLLYGAVRHLGRIEALFTPLMHKEPRVRVKAILLLAGFELIEGGAEGHVARVVHHAVEQTKALASPAEAKMVNAVVRKLATALAAETVPAKLASAKALADYYSHPAWLVERWLAQFGAADTRALMEWNLAPAPMYARWRRADRTPNSEELVALTPAAWDGFYAVKSGQWPLVEAMLRDGRIFIQDPATRHAVALLDPQPGESVLDLCAAPGGKSLAIADRLGEGAILAVDFAGPRQRRLEENLAKVPKGVRTTRMGLDLRIGWRELVARTPAGYPAVLLDVPCSNTGVIRHRVDVKWRLQPFDFGKHARQQLGLLEAASKLVAVDGRLVYSTCSLDAEENEGVITAFLRQHEGQFVLAGDRVCRPWSDGHDGAAAYLLKRVS